MCPYFGPTQLWAFLELDKALEFGGLVPLTWQLPGLSPSGCLSSGQCLSSGTCGTYLRRVLMRSEEPGEADAGQHRAEERAGGLG